MATEYNFYFVPKLINTTTKAKAKSCPESPRSRVPGELGVGRGVDDFGDDDVVGDAVKHESYSSKSTLVIAHNCSLLHALSHCSLKLTELYL